MFVLAGGTRAHTLTLTSNTNPNQLLLYKLYFTMSISNWLVFMVSARAINNQEPLTLINTNMSNIKSFFKYRI